MRRNSLTEAWDDFRADKMVDPAKRYIHDDQEIFIAGWRAAQSKPRSVQESIWVSAPVAPDDDPE